MDARLELVHSLSHEVKSAWNTHHRRRVPVQHDGRTDARAPLRRRPRQRLLVPLSAQPTGDDAKLADAGEHEGSPGRDQDGAQQLGPLQAGAGLVLLPAHGSEGDAHQSQEGSGEQQGSSGLLAVQQAVGVGRAWSSVDGGGPTEDRWRPSSTVTLHHVRPESSGSLSVHDFPQRLSRVNIKSN